MKKVIVSKALEEVWEWKEKCYEEAKGMKMLDYLKKVHIDVERLLKKRRNMENMIKNS